jgi:hypothetical protein
MNAALKKAGLKPPEFESIGFFTIAGRQLKRQMGSLLYERAAQKNKLNSSIFDAESINDADLPGMGSCIGTRGKT